MHDTPVYGFQSLAVRSGYLETSACDTCIHHRRCQYTVVEHKRYLPTYGLFTLVGPCVRFLLFYLPQYDVSPVAILVRLQCGNVVQPDEGHGLQTVILSLCNMIPAVFPSGFLPPCRQCGHPSCQQHACPNHFSHNCLITWLVSQSYVFRFRIPIGP